MKKIFLPFLVLMFAMSSCTTFKIASHKVNDATATYYLPKKDLLLGFNVTYKTIQKIRVKNTIKTTTIDANNSVVESTNVDSIISVEYVPNSLEISDIQIEENIFPDYTQGYHINSSNFLKNNGGRKQQTISFYSGTQIISSINGEAGTYTKEILQGIATGLQIIGKVVGAVFSAGTTAINPLKNNAYIETISMPPTQNAKGKTSSCTVVYDSLDVTTYKRGYLKTIQAEDEKTTIIISETSPPQTLQLTALRLTNSPIVNNVSENDSLKLFYRDPAIIRYQLENITQSSPKLLFSKIVSVPQLGTLKSIDTKVKGRNPYLAIDFDENGGLKKYEINTDKEPTDNAEMIQKLGDNTKDLITDYRLQKIQNQFNYLDLMKQINDLKTPASQSK